VIAAAGLLHSVLLAADRQTIMLRAFWTLVVAAGLVSIGAWILLAREVRVQRRRRNPIVTGAEGGDGTEAPTSAVPDDDGARPAAHPVEVPADTADVGDAGDRA